VEDEINTTIATDIVKAYISNNSVAIADLPALIGDVHAALQRIARAESAQPVTVSRLVPAVPVEKSVAPGFLIYLEDGKKFKSLKRHLMSAHDMTPAEYRAKWDLPVDYPMAAPGYAAHRSVIAKAMGLGQGRRRRLPRERK
jgi:predicted transcriptional regulator